MKNKNDNKCIEDNKNNEKSSFESVEISDSSHITENDEDAMNSTSIYSNWSKNLKEQNKAILTVNKTKFTVDCNDFDPKKMVNEKKNYPTSRHLKYKYAKQHEGLFKSKRKTRNPIRICIMNSRYEVIGRIAKEIGYKCVNYRHINFINKVKESDMWNICWTDTILGVDVCKDMRRFQKINHFPGMFEICRKDLLARNLNRMLRLFPLDYQFFPKTWCFPADLGDAISYSKQHKNKTFIIKPDQGAQGKGIWITKNLRDIKPGERMICQVYINKPLLIDGYKFDLRVYTLITSTDPLRIFVFNEGLVRFATSKYREPSGHNTTNMFMHLTNYSVNKHSRTFSYDDEAGSKRKFSSLNRLLSIEGFNVEDLWANIDDIIVKTLLSAWPMLKHNYNACFPTHDVIQACFEILGIDILVDHKLKPYVLEVNHSPSFHTDEQVDREVKESLIRDTFGILNITNEDKRRVIDEDKKRVKNRLLQRIIKDTIFIPNNHGGGDDERPSPAVAQIEWEETHMGGFRRIMPSPGNPEKYTPFFILQNQASVYCDTAASKRREEASKLQRAELSERAKIKTLLLNPKTTRNFFNLKTINEDDEKVTKKKKKTIKIQRDFYQPDNIFEYDERERLTLLAQRDFLVRSCGLLQSIYSSFYRNDLLTNGDRNKYRDLFTKLTNIDTSLYKLPITMNKANIKDELSVDCSEAPMVFRQPFPNINKSIVSCCGKSYKSNKATIARQITNTVKNYKTLNHIA